MRVDKNEAHSLYSMRRTSSARPNRRSSSAQVNNCFRTEKSIPMMRNKKNEVERKRRSLSHCAVATLEGHKVPKLRE